MCVLRNIIHPSWPYRGTPRWLPAGYNLIKRPVYVACLHISQSLFPHHICAIAPLCRVCVCVCVSCPSLLPPPPRRLGVCTLRTVLGPTSEPPGTTTKAHSPLSGMYRHDHHPPSPLPFPLRQPPPKEHLHYPEKLINFYLFFPPHFPLSPPTRLMCFSLTPFFN